MIKSTNYYAKIKYRGKENDYRVVAEEGNDLRIEYIDYNPNRGYDTIWVKNGKDRIIMIYADESPEHKHYITLNKIFQKNIKEIEESHKSYYNVEHPSLGTSHYYQAYKKAIKDIKSAEK